MVKRAGWCATGSGNRRDAGRPGSGSEHQSSGRIQDCVGLVLPRRSHDLVRSFYMEWLPYIDEHVISVGSDRAATWSALVGMWCRDPDDLSTLRSPFFRLHKSTPSTHLALD